MNETVRPVSNVRQRGYDRFRPPRCQISDKCSIFPLIRYVFSVIACGELGSRFIRSHFSDKERNDPRAGDVHKQNSTGLSSKALSRNAGLCHPSLTSEAAQPKSESTCNSESASTGVAKNQGHKSLRCPKGRPPQKRKIKSRSPERKRNAVFFNAIYLHRNGWKRCHANVFTKTTPRKRA